MVTGSVSAVYHALDKEPPVTAAVFPTADDPALVERAAFVAIRDR
jgi:hypothetical protein